MEGQGHGCGAVEGKNNQAMMLDDVLDLPPGFRFHPTDEEVVTHYLTPKLLDPDFIAAAITEVDLNKCEPWDMPSRAKVGEKDWYFFCQKDRKYPTGTRTNRATKAGYWKATGKDKEIYRGRGKLVGMKKTLVFYKGRAPKGEKTNWVMHEFRLDGQFPYHRLPHVNKDEWVVCRVFNKSMGEIVVNNDNLARQPEGTDSTASFIDELLENSSPPPPPPPLVDPSNIACFNYSSKLEYSDLVDGKYPAGVGDLPRPAVQNYNPFGNSGYSLQGMMDSQFSEGLELQARPGMSEQCKGEPFTLSRDEIEFDGDKEASIDANNEMSSAVTTLNRFDSGMWVEGADYEYLESLLMDASDHNDLTLESLMNQENPSFLPVGN